MDAKAEIVFEFSIIHDFQPSLMEPRTVIPLQNIQKKT